MGIENYVINNLIEAMYEIAKLSEISYGRTLDRKTVFTLFGFFFDFFRILNPYHTKLTFN